MTLRQPLHTLLPPLTPPPAAIFAEGHIQPI
jgi:hypothetical protein